MTTRQQNISRWRFSLKCVGIHLTINLLMVVMLALLVFYVWYPFPYFNLMGGFKLFTLIIAVDFTCGPLLTSILANPRKSRRELISDFSIVGLIQLLALVYGFHTVYLARPVIVAFEVDRFTAVSSVEIDNTFLRSAPKELQKLPLFSITRVATRQPRDVNEKLESLALSLQGLEPSARPNWWLPDNQSSRVVIQKKMHPLSALIQHYPKNTELSDWLKKHNQLQTNQLYFLPFTSSKIKDWVVILNKNADFIGYLHINGFVK